jgi:glycosyltransferase involved in cell wall biosynthesis
MDQYFVPVSIGIPVYNGERYLEESLESFLAQTFREFELIICDNASTDRTSKICGSFAARDARIRYVRNPTNVGAAANYRLAFELSHGKYFKWATYDDICAPEFVARCVGVLDTNPTVALAYTRTKLIDAEGQVYQEYQDDLDLGDSRPSERFVGLLERLKLCNALYGLIRADVLRRTALLASFIASDVPLLAELALYGKFHEVQEFLFFRRIHAAAGSSIPQEDLVMEFYDPKRKGTIPFTECRHFGAHVRSVSRAPLGMAERLRLVRILWRLGLNNRAKLAREISWGARRMLWKLRNG